jgi:serine/threonine protein kinase
MKEYKNSDLKFIGKRFRIMDEMLGVGSFGKTYVGKDLKLKNDVAIKTVNHYLSFSRIN